MPSLADRGRSSAGSRLELALRIAAFVALAGWIANAARPAVSRRETVRGAALPVALARWTHGRVDSVRVVLDTVPDAASLAWLAALQRAGVGVTWSGATISDVALETYVPADPMGGVVALVASREAAPRVVSDALGPVDTLRDGASIIRLASVEGGLTVTSGSQPARAQAAAVAAPRRILVTGTAGWEPKFIIAALEERGWQVDAHLSVAPDRDVTQGGGRAGLDTARYSAVVLLDSASAENTRGAEQFVRSGGGVVLAGDANLAGHMAGLVAWRAGKRATAPLGTLAGDTTWRGLSVLPLQLLPERRAIVLEQRNGQPVVTARRHYAGRVIGVGYDQTWRWRMSGDESRVAHRDYWSRVVASVALRPASTSAVRTGAAPRVELFEALGPPSAAGRALAINFSPSAVSGALGLVILLTLLSEWLLRRARGAK